MKVTIFILFSVLLIINLAKGQDYIKLGNDELDKGNYEKAIEYYSLNIQKYPGWGSYSAYFNRGLAYCSLTKFDEAIADYTKTIELEPAFTDAYFTRGTAYDELQKYDEAIADYTKSIELKTNYDAYAYYFRGAIYDKLQKYDEAIADYTKAVDLSCKVCIPRLALSVLYYNKQNYDEAKIWMNNSIVMEPRLNEGLAGIEKLEREGWNFSAEQKEALKKIFELMGK
jgi:tetratricopeptide (TPR) repeat protein